MELRKLTHISGMPWCDEDTMVETIIAHASLKIDFGWSFESSDQLSSIMNECIEHFEGMRSQYYFDVISDFRGNWIGFIPFGTIDTTLGVEQLIQYNNGLINFQTAIVKFIVSHTCFQQHAVLRDDNYRYEYLKKLRHNPDDLSDFFHYYIDAIYSTTGINMVFRKHLDIQISCHYLYYPEIYFELLTLYTLRGIIFE
jgi:hypothetical protein